MPFATSITFNSIIVFPPPKLVAKGSVAVRTGYTNESSGCFTPRYPIEVPWPSTNATHEPPMPITSRKIALNVSSCFTQRITAIERMDDLAIFTNHSLNPPNDLIQQTTSL